jgi:hypothetical protein
VACLCQQAVACLPVCPAGYFAWRGVLQAEDDPVFVEQLKKVS